MKKDHTKARMLLALIMLILAFTPLHAQLGVGTATPDASAQLDVVSTTRGALLPRMTSAQMNAISDPAPGLLVYCLDCTPAGLYHNNGSGYVAITDLNYQNSNFSGDNLGHHTATQNINLSDKKLVGDTGTIGITITRDGKVGIATRQTTLISRLLIDSVTTSIPGLQIGRNMGAGQSNTQILAGASRQDRGFRLITANPSAGFFMNMLTHNLDYNGSQYTQGDWDGSSSIEFRGGNIVIKTDSEITGGSNGPITPTTTMTLSEGNYVRLSSGSWVNAFSDDGTLSGNNDSLVPTASAVKAYVDNSGGLIMDNATNRNIHGGQLNLRNLSTGTHNLALGYQALDSVTTGTTNVAAGYFAGLNTTTGARNTYLGGHAGRLNKTGNKNVAIGDSALHSNTSGSSNVAIGAGAGKSNPNGVSNVYLGHAAGHNSTTNDNVMIGQQAGFNSRSQSSVYLGYQAGFYDTTIANTQRLYIDNNNTNSPLLGGDFAKNKFGINMHIDSLNRDSRATFQVGGDMQFMNGTNINEFSTDGTMLGNSDNAIPTEKAVKQYVDARGPALETVFNFNPSTQNNVYEQYLGNFFTSSGPIEIKVGDELNNHFGGAYMRVMRPYNEAPVVTYQERGSGGEYRLAYRIINFTEFELFLVNASNANNAAVHRVEVYCPHAYSYNANAVSQNNTSIDTAAVRHYVDVRPGFHGSSIGTYTTGATLNVNGSLKLELGKAVKEFSTDSTLIGNSREVVPTEQAVKMYVDNYGGLINAGNNNVHGDNSNMINLTTGNSNLALGNNALLNVNTGEHNTAIGANALTSTRSGSGNVAIGLSSLLNNNTGTSNVAIGTNAGASSTGDTNVYIGNFAGQGASGDHQLYIENSHSNTPLIGGNFKYDRVGIDTAISSLNGSGATLTVGGDLVLKEGVAINKFSNDALGSSTTVVPTEQAVKTYVDNNARKITSTSLSAYTVANTDYVVNANSSAASDQTLTLPDATNLGGKVYVIKNSVSSNPPQNVIVNTTSSQTMDNVTSITLTQYQSVTVQSDGSNWIIINRLN